ncbi:MAG: OB-fold nucleic acid binding domain-containing protein, partial [Nitrospiraceae bacterium]
VLDRTLEEAAAIQRERERGQISMFGEAMGEGSACSPLSDPPLPNIPEWDQGLMLKYERELTGFYITAHPLARYAAVIEKFSTAKSDCLAELSDGKEIRLCGIVNTVKLMTTKKGDRMAYFTLEDLHGMIEIIAFPDLYKSSGALMTPESLIRVTGMIDRAEKGTRLKGTKIESLTDLQARAITRVNLRLGGQADTLARLPQLHDILRRYPGQASIYLTFCLTSHEADTAPLPNLTVTPSDGFITEVEEVLGKGAVALL